MKLIFLTDDKEEIIEKLEELFRKENYKEILSERNGISVSIVKPKEQIFLEENVLLKKVILQMYQETNLTIGNLLEFDGICMDLLTHEVTVHCQVVKLTKTEYSILKIFLQHPEEVIQKQVFLEHNEDYILDCVENSLKVHISNLRRKLKDITGNDYIECVRGVGFMLVYPKHKSSK